MFFKLSCGHIHVLHVSELFAIQCLFVFCLLSLDSESVRVKPADQRIGVSGIATAFRIISRFCLNRIWLEELNQLCPRITRMTLEGGLEPSDQVQSSTSCNRAYPYHLSTFGLHQQTEHLLQLLQLKLKLQASPFCQAKKGYVCFHSFGPKEWISVLTWSCQ